MSNRLKNIGVGFLFRGVSSTNRYSSEKDYATVMCKRFLKIQIPLKLKMNFPQSTIPRDIDRPICTKKIFKEITVERGRICYSPNNSLVYSAHLIEEKSQIGRVIAVSWRVIVTEKRSPLQSLIEKDYADGLGLKT